MFPKPNAVVLDCRADLGQNVGLEKIDPDFEKRRPHMITAHGQHRFAMLNAAYCKEFGLSLARGGDLGDGGLFEGLEGESWLNRSRSNESILGYPSDYTEWSSSSEKIHFSTVVEVNVYYIHCTCTVIGGRLRKQTWRILQYNTN